jgi:LysR family glycine cleavage system transcriptional activator
LPPSGWCPGLSTFIEEHPDIKIRLSASHGHTDFSHADIDIDIRYGLSRWPDLHVETIFEEEVLPLISPKLKEKLNLRSPEELLFQNLILSNVNLVQWPQWFAAHGVSISPSDYAVSFDRAYLSIQAAVQSLGIALESNRMAEPLVHRSRDDAPGDGGWARRSPCPWPARSKTVSARCLSALQEVHC